MLKSDFTVKIHLHNKLDRPGPGSDWTWISAGPGSVLDLDQTGPRSVMDLDRFWFLLDHLPFLDMWFRTKRGRLIITDIVGTCVHVLLFHLHGTFKLQEPPETWFYTEHEPGTN